MRLIVCRGDLVGGFFVSEESNRSVYTIQPALECELAMREGARFFVPDPLPPPLPPAGFKLRGGSWPGAATGG